jgi:hypothetical protein
MTEEPRPEDRQESEKADEPVRSERIESENLAEKEPEEASGEIHETDKEPEFSKDSFLTDDAQDELVSGKPLKDDSDKTDSKTGDSASIEPSQEETAQGEILSDETDSGKSFSEEPAKEAFVQEEQEEAALEEATEKPSEQSATKDTAQQEPVESVENEQAPVEMQVDNPDDSQPVSQQDKNSEEHVSATTPPDHDTEHERGDVDQEETMTGEALQTSQNVDYSTLSKAQIIKEFRFLLESRHVNSLRNEVDNLKINFYKRHKQEIEKQRKIFYEQGGALEDFQPEEDPQELEFKEVFKEFRRLKAIHNRELEEQKIQNLSEKQKILEELKELVNRKEDVNRTFQEFRELQKKWHAAGMVPQQHVKDLWESYHLYVEQFYDHIKINKELRDLDLKKNLEAKIALCEKAEELLLEPSIINAFRILQRYHDQWREIGPVPLDQKEVIWERFREITHQINKKHQEHYDSQRDTQKKNLEAKTLLCEKAEALSEQEFFNIQELESLTREMLGLQKMWKSIGFAPRKDNNKIYQRFRIACDGFFTRKREFNAVNREKINENLQMKLDLCAQAEALKESTDWKKTTEELISMQRKWKEIGPVPRKFYDSLWKRFRSACDHFFNRKSQYFSTIDNTYEDNLKKKEELIQKIESLDAGGDVNKALNKLKEYQREWSEIGFVPIKLKDEIQKRYRAALDKHFESLKIDDQKKNILRFRNKLETMSNKGIVSNKMKFEREKYLNKLKQLENDITLWENNIGFFAKSKNADAMVKEFQDKIEQGKIQIKLLEEKINMIDELDQG